MSNSYKIDTNQSKIEVQASAAGVLSGAGHNPDFAVRDFSGDAEFSPDSPEQASLNLTIKTDSLEVTNRDIDKDDKQEVEKRTLEEVLEVSSNPEITFKSNDVSADKGSDNWYRLEITGELSLHGVTNTETVDVQLKVRDDSLDAEGEFTLRQSDYNKDD